MLRSRGGSRRPTPAGVVNNGGNSSFEGADASSFLFENGGDLKKVRSSAVGNSPSACKQRIANMAIISVAAAIGICAGLGTLSLMGVLPPMATSSNPNAISAAVSQNFQQLLRRPSQRQASTYEATPASRHPQFVYSTPEFKQTCSWTYHNGNVRKPCQFLVRPMPNSGEGIAQWVSSVAHGYIYSVQSGCSLVIDYGPTVEVDKVWSPPASLQVGQSWVNTPGMECTDEKNCLAVGMKEAASIQSFLDTKLPGSTARLAEVPNYRMAYSRSDNATGAVEKLEAALPGFRYEKGFACAFGHLFDLPKSAADYLPTLFTDILPAIRDPAALVLTVYIRTGRTDDKAREEKGGEMSGNHNHTHVDSDLLQCAAEQEKQKLLDDAKNKYNSVVWLVITDSAEAASSVVAQYSGKMESVIDRKKVSRRVISTQSQGIQTRPARNPSTGDFADAALDWWLIGEADMLITHGAMSFGTTAALRTAIPFYTAMKGECKRRELDMDGSAVVPGFVQVQMPVGGGPLNILEQLKKQGFKVNGKEIKGIKRIDQ